MRFVIAFRSFNTFFLFFSPSKSQKSSREPEESDKYSKNGKIESEPDDHLSFTGSRKSNDRESEPNEKAYPNILSRVDLMSLYTLKKWSLNNRNRLCRAYKIPHSERNDEFLSDVMFTFNPTVKIEPWMFLDDKDECDAIDNDCRDYRNRIRQEEFAKELGLIHVNDKMLTAQSRRSFRQRKVIIPTSEAYMEMIPSLEACPYLLRYFNTKFSKTYLLFKSIRDVEMSVSDRIDSLQQTLTDKSKEQSKSSKNKPVTIGINERKTDKNKSINIGINASKPNR